MMRFTTQRRDAWKWAAANLKRRGYIREARSCAGGLTKASTKKRRSWAAAASGKTRRNLKLLDLATPAKMEMETVSTPERSQNRPAKLESLALCWWAVISDRPPPKLFACRPKKNCCTPATR